MPRRCITDPRLPALIAAQDFVLHRHQALAAGLTPRAIGHRLDSAQWQLLLPDVYLTHPGEPSRRQQLKAALLYAGDESAVDAADACRFHGVQAVAVDDHVVAVATPQDSSARNRGFVVIRRTSAPINVVRTPLLRYVDPAMAVVAATRRMTRERQVLAVMSDALQRGVVGYPQLVRAHVQGPPRNAGLGDLALERLGAGVRSAPEADFMLLAQASLVLPPMEYNVTLRLPSGRIMCVDALIRDAALVHETNGRVAHARADLFEDMQERHSILTAAGFVVLHNPPRRIRLRGREVIAEVERCYLANAGRGMPSDVSVLGVAA